MGNEARNAMIFLTALVLVIVAGATISTLNYQRAVQECQDSSGVYHQHNCMKSEYFVDLQKGTK